MMSENIVRKRVHPVAKGDTVTPVSVHEPERPNPFCHSIHLSNWDKCKILVMSITVLPLRIVCVMVCLVISWSLACIGLIGVSKKDLRERPLTGWRRSFASGINFCGRLAFRISGYQVRVKGRLASRSEAPLVVVGPHTTFADAMIIYWITLPHLISRDESRATWLFGKRVASMALSRHPESEVSNTPDCQTFLAWLHLPDPSRRKRLSGIRKKNPEALINYTQPIYVVRDDPNSRANTVKEMVRRATSDDDWQQILIFPEGTCTNGKALITFKPGAFYAGVPVQPVCLKYPNRLNTLSWTWSGPGALEILWYTMTQFVTYAEIEFLPPYVPSEEEKRNPILFASNVRREMAKCLDVPVVDYTYEDCRLMSKARKLGLPSDVGLVEAALLKAKHGINQKELETNLLERFADIANKEEGMIRLEDFAAYLQIPVNNPCLQHVFKIYDADGSGALTFKKFVVGQISISQPANSEENLKTTFELLDRGSKGFINFADVTYAMEKSFAGSTASLKCPIFGLSEDTEISYDDLVEKVQKKPEYAKFFEIFLQSYAPAS